MSLGHGKVEVAVLGLVNEVVDVPVRWLAQYLDTDLDAWYLDRTEPPAPSASRVRSVRRACTTLASEGLLQASYDRSSGALMVRRTPA